MSIKSVDELTDGAKKEKQPGPEESITDLSRFSEGDIFPGNKKRIRLVIVQERNYIVFLDDKLYVRYWHLEDYEVPADFGEVIIRQANLEATSMLLLEKSQLEVFRRLLAESVGRLFDDGNSENAHIMLDKAEVFLRARSRERARGWYLSASVITTAIILSTALVLWILRGSVLALIQAPESVIDVILGTAVGSLGALVSVLQRSDELRIDVSAGSRVHYFEGALRMGVGAIAGFLFALAIKSNILLGAVNNSQRSLSLLLVICIVAGASERLLPSLIRQLEGTLVERVEELQVVEEGGGKTDDSTSVTTAKEKPQKRFLFRRRE